MFRYLEQFNEKDVSSYRFRDELYFRTKESLEKKFTDPKNNVVDYGKVQSLSSLILDIFKLGEQIGKGKTYADFKREYDEEVIRTHNMLIELGVIEP